MRGTIGENGCRPPCVAKSSASFLRSCGAAKGWAPTRSCDSGSGIRDTHTNSVIVIAMGSLHALFILLCPAITVVALFHKNRDKKTPAATKVASLPIWSGVVVGLWGFATMFCLCREGNGGFAQWAVPMCCLFAVSAVRDKKIRWLVTALLFAAGLALPRQFEILAHSNAYTSVPGWEGDRFVILRSEMQRIEGMRDEIHVGEAAPPSGWIEDVFPDYQWNKIVTAGTRKIDQPEWHSVFTRLHRATYLPVGIWYPGGPWEEGVQGLEIRDR